MSQIIDLKQIKLGEAIGYGATSVVYKGTWGKRPVAVKTYKYLCDADFAENEVEILQTLNHTNIINMYGYSHKENKFISFIVYELMEGGTLYDYLITSKNIEINWSKRLQFIMQIVNGFNYLHDSSSIIHLDLKSLNILLDQEKKIIKIADFGLAKYSLIDLRKSIEPSNCARGTTRYMAPELFSSEPPTEKCDVWSFGAVLLEFSNRAVPFSDLENTEIMRILQNKSAAVPIQVHGNTPKIIKKLINKCLKRDPSSRPPFSQIKSRLESEINNPVTANYQDHLTTSVSSKFQSSKTQPVNNSEFGRGQSLSKIIGQLRIHESTSKPNPEYTAQSQTTHTLNASLVISNSLPMTSTNVSTKGTVATNYRYVSRGSANGRLIYQGPNGGLFYFTPSGNKTYI